MAPDGVFAAALEAREAEDFESLAELLSDDFLRGFQRDHLAWTRRWLLEHLREPAAVGASLTTALPSNRIRNIPLAAIPGSPSLEALEALSGRVFFVQWAVAAVRAAVVLEEPRKAQPYRIIGSVEEDAQWAHVLYRCGEMVLGPERTFTATLHRDRDRWLIYWLSEPLVDEGPLGRLLAIAG